MEVTNTSAYRPWKLIRNGINGEFAQINLDSPKFGGDELLNYVTLLVRFLDSATGAPLVLDRFRMSFYDFDQGVQGRARECFSTRGYSDVQVSPGYTQINSSVADPVDSTFTGFCSTQYGVLDDNPTSPVALTDHQRSKSIELLFEQTSQ
eukprot:6147647-Prymnesium_polylepis.1